MSSVLTEILDPLKTAPPEISDEYAKEVAWRYYGLRGNVSHLTSERDQNFHLRTFDGHEYVLKLANPAESHDVGIFQNLALMHIAEAAPHLPVPRVVKNLDGDHSFVLPVNDRQILVRLLTFLTGEQIYQAPRSAAQRYNIGRMSASLSHALHDFSHPAANHRILWDIQHARHLRKLLQHMTNDRDQNLATRFLDRFERHALPHLLRQRSQVVHNDLNPHNLLVQPDNPDIVAGILDFGDMVYTPLINDVAVTASYLVSTTGNPMEPVVDMLAGYQSVMPLYQDELILLPDLIATRYVMNVAITGWRAARYPENRDYILRNNRAAWMGLQSFETWGREDMQSFLLNAAAST